MKTISTSYAPIAIGPYSQAIVHQGVLYSSGQIALDPRTNKLIDGSIEQQTKRVLSNLDSILEASGSSRSRVIKTTVFLSSMENYAVVNQLYANFFGDHKPARSTIEVSRLPKDVLIEIELIAAIL